MASLARKVLVPIAHGTEPMEAIITIDVLRRFGADVTVVSAAKELRVEALFGIKIVADAFVSDVAGTIFDLIALPGGVPGVENLRDCGALESLVKKHVADRRLYAAVCVAPAVVLGPWGLLKGLKATCHPSFMEKLASYASSTTSATLSAWEQWRICLSQEMALSTVASDPGSETKSRLGGWLDEKFY